MADIYEQAAKSIIVAADNADNISLDKSTSYKEDTRAQFLDKYKPEILRKLNDDELLKVMFIGGGSTESLCNWLMYKTKEGFGDFAGYPWQFGLYRKKGHGWTTDNVNNLSAQDALAAGKEILSKLLACCDTVQARIDSNCLESLDDYMNLQKEMDEKTKDRKFAAQSWVRKYLYLWQPEFFVFWYTPDKILAYLNVLKITPAASIYGEIWQILQIEKSIAEQKDLKREDLNGRLGPFCWTVWSKNLLSEIPVGPETDRERHEPDQQVQKVREKWYETGIKPGVKRNRILFGAPGTGKSYILNQDKNKLLDIKKEDDEKPDSRVERVTFHPEYSYANFVGTYKPESYKNDKGEDSIKYTYVSGPFMRTYIKAWENILAHKKAVEENIQPIPPIQPYLLIIEEINRSNAAAAFGDIFQLLDRKGNGYSEYSIQASEDIRRHLKEDKKWADEYRTDLRMPDNMFIWATMNSADQGVFPMDTAFKRRWNFEYIGIGDENDNLPKYWVTLGTGKDATTVEWQSLRMAINDWMADKGINEDKQIGPYFITNLPDGVSEEEKTKLFNEVFTNKILMYLFEDAAKQRRNDLFSGQCNNKNRYSVICRDFRSLGVKIFNENIQSKIKTKAETEAVTESVTETEAEAVAETE